MQELTLEEAETIALSILKQIMEEKVWQCRTTPHTPSISSVAFICMPTYCLVFKQVTPNNVDIAKVAPKYHLYTTPLPRSKQSSRGCEETLPSFPISSITVVVCMRSRHLGADLVAMFVNVTMLKFHKGRAVLDRLIRSLAGSVIYVALRTLYCHKFCHAKLQ